MAAPNPGNADTTSANRTTAKKKHKARCRKGFRKAKRHGKSICAKKKHHKAGAPRSGSDGTRTRDLRRDRPAL
jgi:hypothetical protein